MQKVHRIDPLESIKQIVPIGSDIYLRAVVSDVIDPLRCSGHVVFYGVRWRAAWTGSDACTPGTEVEVLSRQGNTLFVKQKR